MVRRIPLRITSCCWALFVGPAYFLAALVALKFTSGPNDTASIWIPSGIVLAALLLAERRALIQILAATAAASFAANELSGVGHTLSLAYTVANVVEAIATLVLVQRWLPFGMRFEDPVHVGRFARICVISTSASTAIAMLTSASYSLDFAISWFATVLLGQLVFAPLIITVYQKGPQFYQGGGLRRRREILAVAAGVFGTSLLVFLQSELALLFLPVLPILLATYRFGPLGAAIGVAIVALVGSFATLNGWGPCTFMRPDWLSPVMFLQVFLIALLASVLPLAVALSARNEVYNELKRQQRFFELASKTASVGHWRLDLETQELEWSDEVFRIHGLPVGAPPALDQAINAYHPDDRAMVAKWLDDCIASSNEFAFDARIITPQGELRYVNSRGCPEVDVRGNTIALFGVFQDVTDRVLTNLRLDEARAEAIFEAQHARTLAETDQLTGIANRRKTMQRLREVITNAETTRSVLTIAMLDIDHFKTINDCFGHATGDEVIRQVAQICTDSVRHSDIVGRIGGEEFLILLPGAALESAAAIAERIRIECMKCTAKNAEIPAVTVSIGLAGFSPGMPVENLLQAADEALYQAKRDGRNLLRVA